jgi:predicted AAA+ superfamily ATPase
LERLERLLPSATPAEPAWGGACAFRWDHQLRTLRLVENFQRIALSDLHTGCNITAGNKA